MGDGEAEHHAVLVMLGDVAVRSGAHVNVPTLRSWVSVRLSVTTSPSLSLSSGSRREAEFVDDADVEAPEALDIRDAHSLVRCVWRLDDHLEVQVRT